MPRLGELVGLPSRGTAPVFGLVSGSQYVNHAFHGIAGVGALVTVVTALDVGEFADQERQRPTPGD